MWSGLQSNIPSGWYLCDGNNGTPDLRNRFIVGAGTGGNYSRGDTGGSTTATLVSHSHTINNHTHTFSDSFSGNTGYFDTSHTHGYQSANHPTGSGPEQNQTGSPEDRTTFNVNKNTGGPSGNSNHRHTFSGSVSGTTGDPSDRGTNTQGSSATNANLPPYYALCYIMKS